MANGNHKLKTDLLLEAIMPKEYMNFERFLVSKLGKTHNVNYFEYWQWKKDCMLKLKKGRAGAIKPYREKLSRKFLSDFNKLIECYFVSVAVQDDELMKKLLLLGEMRKRKVDRLFLDYLKNVKDLNNGRASKDIVNNVTALRSYFEEYMLFNALSDETGMTKIAGNICRISEIVYFQNELFNFINIKLYLGEDFHPLLKVDLVMKKIEADSDYFEKSHTNVYVLYLIVKLIKEYKTIDDLAKVLMYLNKREKKFTDTFLKIAYESLFKLATLRIDSEDNVNRKIAYNIFKDMEHKGVLKKIPHIQPLIFFSGFSLSLSYGDTPFAQRLLNKYGNKLLSVPHDDVLTVCRAMIDYEKGKLVEAKNLLLNIKFKNVSLYLYSKATILKVMYDNNELRGIMSLSDSVKHFLLRKKEVQASNRESIFKFLSYATNLAVAKRKKGRGLFQLRERFNSGQNFFQKNWVSEKLKELEETR